MPVPNGSRNRSVAAAIIAQKKLDRSHPNVSSRDCNVRLSDVKPRPRCLPAPEHLSREEIRYFLEREQYASDGRAECDCYASGGSCAKDLTSFGWRDILDNKPGTRGRRRWTRYYGTSYAPSFVSYLTNQRLTIFPKQLAMCTNGPSLPTIRYNPTLNQSRPKGIDFNRANGRTECEPRSYRHRQRNGLGE